MTSIPGLSRSIPPFAIGTHTPGVVGVGGQGQAQAQAQRTIQLSAELLYKLKPAKQFKDAIEQSDQSLGNGATKKTITSICFDDVGDKLVSAGEDDMFVLWDARKGRKVKSLYSRKYGIDHVRFTHKSGTIVHASTKGDDHAVRYHSMHDNKYLSYFKGHTAKVRSISMSPIDDTFVSAGDDGTVRLWDLRQNACRAVVQDMGGSTIAAIDNQGIVFAVACSDTQTILLYGSNNSDKAPFAHSPLIDIAFESISQPPPKPIFTSIQFSNDGHHLLIGTSSDVHYILDGYDLTPLRRLVGHQGLERNSSGSGEKEKLHPRRGNSGSEVSWSSDGQFVISGSADGSVLFWQITSNTSTTPGSASGTGQPVKKLVRDDVKESERANTPWHRIRIPEIKPKVVLRGTGGLSRAVRFNPRYNLLAVAGEDLTLWLPGRDEEEQVPEGW